MEAAVCFGYMHDRESVFLHTEINLVARKGHAIKGGRVMLIGRAGILGQDRNKCLSAVLIHPVQELRRKIHGEKMGSRLIRKAVCGVRMAVCKA